MLVRQENVYVIHPTTHHPHRQISTLQIFINDWLFFVFSDRTLKQRCETVEKFTTGIYNILVATDVAARGLNFPLVQYVINYDLYDMMIATICKENLIHLI